MRLKTAGCFAMGLALVWGGVFSAGARAQAGTPGFRQVQRPGYPVTGRVVCADTQRPARFATVTLLPASDDEGGGFEGRGRRLSARTDLDGNFVVSNVPPGDYFVTGQLAGYINETGAVESAVEAASNATPVPADVPKVHVGAGGASTALSLQRGGVIAGTVQWDDGSPAGGVQISVQAPPATGAQGGSATQAQLPGFGRGGAFGGPGGFGGYGGFGGAQTDDRGHFRLAGLAPGSYLVRASVQAPAPQGANERGFGRALNLFVYAPDKPRRTDATAITLAAGEERDDVGITLGMAALHSVSGVVSSTGAAVRSGSVSLTDQTDSSLNRTGVINADGSFAVPYVPAGNYTLRVNASSQAQATYGRGGFSQTSSSASPTVRFQPLQESVTVTDSDLTGLSLNVTPVTTSAQQ